MTIKNSRLLLFKIILKNDKRSLSLLQKNEKNLSQLIQKRYESSSKTLDYLLNQSNPKEDDNVKIGQINFKHGKTILKATAKGSFYHEKVLLGYSREQMCDLVYDVKRYKEFLPFCLDSKLIDEKPIQQTLHKGINLKLLHNSQSNKIVTPDKKLELPSSFRAKLEIGYPPIRESYISHVSMVRPETVKAISRDTNLFEYLINEWKFHPYERNSEISRNSCIVEFYVSFNFRSSIYNKFSSLIMDQIYKRMLGAFIKRASSLYGKPSLEAKNLS
ncbi:unnamed protein product [Brachionus calyciflorus]|uniref:Coenzyme Q-binding protein COQ10 START domain-containing protein n=1 Tax=Brachionus calyciflorus TaxID=104777 RepID=A0A813RD77_9BILA|nr:unnamed protein product [Brachionus calyciflorus]